MALESGRLEGDAGSGGKLADLAGSGDVDLSGRVVADGEGTEAAPFEVAAGGEVGGLLVVEAVRVRSRFLALA